MIVGVDFGAPPRARDQRRKIIAIAAHSTGWHTYRIDATGMNTRLLANDRVPLGLGHFVVAVLLQADVYLGELRPVSAPTLSLASVAGTDSEARSGALSFADIEDVSSA